MARGRNGARGIDGKAVSADDEANEPVGGIEHNSAARDQIQRECAAEARRIFAERKKLNEEMAENVRKRLRDANINVEAFFFTLKVEERSGDDRDAYLDGLRESFKALGVGVQGTFLTEEFAPPQARPDGDGDDAKDVRPAFMRGPAEGGTRAQ